MHRKGVKKETYGHHKETSSYHIPSTLLLNLAPSYHSLSTLLSTPVPPLRPNTPVAWKPALISDRGEYILAIPLLQTIQPLEDHRSPHHSGAEGVGDVVRATGVGNDTEGADHQRAGDAAREQRDLSRQKEAFKGAVMGVLATAKGKRQKIVWPMSWIWLAQIESRKPGEPEQQDERLQADLWVQFAAQWRTVQLPELIAAGRAGTDRAAEEEQEEECCGGEGNEEAFLMHVAGDDVEHGLHVVG
ncbi:hypothetical protein DFH09DRAFT_1090625 [Mycena vulgaris]|nr:hypothetical protein DFH09DRAFT_1090625 [Mycena vulgaris]